jgi:hypothetical protein
MKEMFEASVDGEPYDMERWGQYFKPAGMGQNTGDPNKAYTPRVSASTPAPVADEDDAPFDTTPIAPVKGVNLADAASAGSDGASRAQDILAMIRNRKQ